MSEGATIGLFTLLGVFVAGAINLAIRWLDSRAEERKLAHDDETRREERDAAELSEIRREGATALVRANRWLVDANPTRLAINVHPDGWRDDMFDLERRLADLEEPLGAISVRLPKAEARNLVGDFVAALARVLHYSGWLVRMVIAHDDIQHWLKDAEAEWTKATELATQVREALHDAGEPMKRE